MSAAFPRVYRLRPRYRTTYLWGGGLLAVTAAGLATWAALAGDRGSLPTVLACGLLFAVLGTRLFLSGLRARIVLTADTISSRGPWGTREFERADIEGWRSFKRRGDKVIVAFCSRTRRMFPAVHVPSEFELDAAFVAWRDSFANLDERDRLSIEAEFFDDRVMPGTRAQKQRRLDRARSVARWLTGIAIASAAWFLLEPRPYALALGAVLLLPLIAVALAAAAGIPYVFDIRKADVLADLTFPVLLPSAVLLPRASEDLFVVDEMKLFWIAIAATCVATGLVRWLVDSLPKRWTWTALTFAVTALYVGGASGLLNRALDFAAPEVFAVQVLDRHIPEDGRKEYHLELAPWGPWVTRREIKVTRDFHARIAAGHMVCVELSPGAFGVRWFEVMHCAGR